MKTILYKNDFENIELLKYEIREYAKNNNFSIHEDSAQQIWLFQLIDRNKLLSGKIVSSVSTLLIKEALQNSVEIAVGKAKWKLKADDNSISSMSEWLGNGYLKKLIENRLEKK